MPQVVFANLTFLYLFLPANLLLYFAGKSPNWRNGVLTAFSLFFYAWGEPVWVLLLLVSAGVNFGCARVIAGRRGKAEARLALVASLVFSLGMLGLFKYSGFVVENLNALPGVSLPLPTLSLPIGISFYTFQIITYVADVYRGEVPAQRSYLKFLMYVSMYPQLVAGPIVRYSQIAREIDHRATSLEGMSRGVSRFCVGLFKKVVVANHAGRLASVYLNGELSSLTAPAAWFGLILFTLQIYYDFSAYSDMAIGLGWMFGFHFKENFNYPYISRSISEFWRRWHISLGSFFRDYVYIPMGGNRKYQMRNLLVVWFLTGLWHGASWNFILWGLYFGLLIALEKFLLGPLLNRLPGILGWCYSMLLVILGWALFYFTDLTRLGAFLKALFGGNPGDSAALRLVLLNNVAWLVLAIFFCLPVTRFFTRLAGRLLPQWGQETVTWVQTFVNLGLVLICTAFLVGQSYNPFLYFRF